MTYEEIKMQELLGLSNDELQGNKADKLDVIEAQVLFTALMTDTLLESEDVE